MWLRAVARDAEEVLLGDGDPRDGEELLRVDRFVDSQEVFLEMGDIVEIFEADDGECGWSEAVFACVLGRAGLALRSARAGGTSGVGAVGGELSLGYGILGHICLLFEEYHEGG